jgi:hypothetical protein
MADFTPTPRAKNSLDHRKLNLNAPAPNAPGQQASLIWGIHANNPRITVYTNDPQDKGADKGYGKISANLDLPVFFAFLRSLDQVIEGPNDVKLGIENKNFIFPQGKRSEKPIVVSTLFFGKDKDGVVWMSVSAKDRPKIKFDFGINDFHHFVKGDGTPYTKAEMSVLFAKGYVRILEEMVPALLVDNYVEPAPKPQQGGGGNYGNRGGNGGGGGNYGGGGNRPAPTQDFGGDSSDLPF